MGAMHLEAVDDKINPSSVSPCDVLTRGVTGVSNRFHLFTLECKPAVCVSAIRVTESYILTPPVQGIRHKHISGVFHSQEWERAVAFVCGVFCQPVLAAQLHKDATQFSTLTEDKSAVQVLKKVEGKKANKCSPAITTVSTAAEPYTRCMEDPGMCLWFPLAHLLMFASPSSSLRLSGLGH